MFQDSAKGDGRSVRRAFGGRALVVCGQSMCVSPCVNGTGAAGREGPAAVTR